MGDFIPGDQTPQRIPPTGGVAPAGPHYPVDPRSPAAPLAPETIDVEVDSAALAAGDTLAGLRLIEPIATGERITCWRAESARGTGGTVHVLNSGATDAERDIFLRGADKLVRHYRGRVVHGVAKIVAVVPGAAAYTTDLSAAGTMADLPMLSWALNEKVAFFRRVCAALGAAHSLGLVHGCLHPSHVLLDDDLKPVLTGFSTLNIGVSFGEDVDGKHEYAPYAARELRQGQPPDARSDVFSLGRLLHFLLLDEQPDERDEELPLLESIHTAPAGLVRIIRRCTARNPDMRYAIVDSLLDDLTKFRSARGVGLEHPEGKEGEDESVESEPPLASDRPGDHPPASQPEPGAQTRSPAAAQPKPQPTIRPRFSVDTPQKDEVDEPLSSKQSLVGAGVGALLLLGAIAMSFFSGFATVVSSSLAIVGAVCLSLIVPRAFGSFLVHRLAMAGLFLFLAIWTSPTVKAAEWGRRHKVGSGSMPKRVAALKMLKTRGVWDFSDLDFSRADFSDLDVSSLTFDRCKFVGARFVNATLDEVSWVDADLTDADFTGASMVDVDVATTVGWQKTTCDEDSEMPEGWLCIDGRPASRHDVGVKVYDALEEEAEEEEDESE